MNYKELTVEGFRGIAKLQLTDLKKLNIFIGKNNAGKTSILESIFLISGLSNPQLPIHIHNFRDLLLTNDADFSYLFHDLDFNNALKISASLYPSEYRRLKIKPSYNIKIREDNDLLDDQKLNKVESNVTTVVSDRVEGIEIEFSVAKSHNSPPNFQKTEISLRNQKVQYSNDYKEKLKCTFLSSKTSLLQLNQRLETIILNKQIVEVIDVLKAVDSKIENITLGRNNMIYVDVGLKQYMPVNIMGDGTNRILSFVTAALDMKNGVLLIDEIENGLHYSSQKVLWKALFKAIKEYDVQLFITTHSYECLQSLNDTITELNTFQNEISLYRIERKKEENKTIKFDVQSLTEALQSNWEIR